MHKKALVRETPITAPGRQLAAPRTCLHRLATASACSEDLRSFCHQIPWCCNDPRGTPLILPRSPHVIHHNVHTETSPRTSRPRAISHCPRGVRVQVAARRKELDSLFLPARQE
jgi:hypothetical protein